jgi:hypothetical protein
MAHVQYSTEVDWDADLRDVGLDSEGYAITALKLTAGVPTAVAGKYRPAATVKNIASGVIYANSGTTASPVFSVVQVV